MYYFWKPLPSVRVPQWQSASILGENSDLPQLPKPWADDFGNKLFSKCSKKYPEFKMKIRSWKGSGFSFSICSI